MLEAAVAPVVASVKKKEKDAKLGYAFCILEECRSVGFMGRASKGFGCSPLNK